jgi:hypothetical protein
LQEVDWLRGFEGFGRWGIGDRGGIGGNKKNFFLLSATPELKN